ncbi:MAG: VTT domain-containing protein [Pseudomonadota bacterium]|nr:VTT domain-containing protein [Pseudomonadota bacterium]
MASPDFLPAVTEHIALFVLSFLAGSVLPLGSEWYVWQLLTDGHAMLGVVIVATLGNTLGGVLTWWLGARGREVWLRRHQDSRRFLWASTLFRRYGIWSLLFSWLPLIGDVLVALAGASGAGWRFATLLMLLGKGARYVMLAYAVMQTLA